MVRTKNWDSLGILKMFGWFGALLCVLSLVFLRGFAYRLAGCTIFVSLGRLVRYTCFIGKKGSVAIFLTDWARLVGILYTMGIFWNLMNWWDLYACILEERLTLLSCILYYSFKASALLLLVLAQRLVLFAIRDRLVFALAILPCSQRTGS